jgi:hypothetical protein
MLPTRDLAHITQDAARNESNHKHARHATGRMNPDDSVSVFFS